MKTAYDSEGSLLPDEKRMTKFGTFLRRTSLDELPQLFNIFLGHMTVIGPRPKQIYETLLMKDTKYVYRMAIKPGLSSWSVIHGRNNLRVDKALNYDFEHVIKYSFFLDVKIFFKTIFMVLKGSGITTEGYATFQPISEFLVLNNLKTPEEVETIRLEAIKIEKSDLKYVPMGISKQDFKNKRRELQKNRKNHNYDQPITWD